MPDITVTISTTEEKALGLDIDDIEAWTDNALREKARRNGEIIVKHAKHVLSAADKAYIVGLISATGEVFCSPEDLPNNIKKEIVDRADMAFFNPEPI